ncbi:MAG: amidohydrolase [Prolixibacteraceae bacterium]|jgi:predicted amidohydrolase|nr:amidohydrolase [Prolixibacteraceae bacterium]
MNNFNVTIVQYNIEWENKQANFRKIEKLASRIDTTDLIVLPEMFSTGFSMNVSEMAEKMSGLSVNWMKQFSVEKNAAVCGSLIIEENGKYYNRLLFVQPDGQVFWYDKRHLFTMGDEQTYYSPGNERLIVEFRGFRILPLICYDLRFPVWSRNQNDFDLMVYVANWPAPRRKAWNTLLKARAIENQSYLIAANRTGTDANGIKYSGGSYAIDAKGKITRELEKNEENIISEKFSIGSLQKFRQKFPVLNDTDRFSFI